jgi:UV DNA damage endonuclease
VKVDSAINDNPPAKSLLQEARPGEDAARVEQDVGVKADPEDFEEPLDEDADEEEVMEALSRPPPVNSEVLPLPWKGRLGYVCPLLPVSVYEN